MRFAGIKIAGAPWTCVAVLVFLAGGILAEEPPGEKLLSAEGITEAVEALTRSINVVYKFDKQDYALPETAPLVSIKNVFFKKGSAELQPAVKAQLDEMAKALQAMRTRGIFVREKPEPNASEEITSAANRPKIPFKVLIEGHTCDLGDVAFNQNLSESRAVAVKDYLVSHGVDTAVFEIKGWGEERPIAPNTEEFRYKNRRVDFVLRPHRQEVPEKQREQPTRSPIVASPRFLEDVHLEATGLPDGRKRLETATDRLHSGDRVQAKFKVSVACHVCTLLLHPDERVDWLLPKNGPDYKQYSLWCQFAKDYEAPELALGSHSGTSILCIIASHAPLPNPCALPEILRRQGESLTAKSLSEDTGVRELEVYVLTVHQE